MNMLSTSVSGGIATLSFNRPRSLNALRPEDYIALADELRRVDARDDVIITLVQGMTSKSNNLWTSCRDAYCSHGEMVFGADVRVRRPDADSIVTMRDNFVRRVASSNTDCSRALYSHSKILVAALNGPVMGIASAFLGHFDFIYCLSDVWLSVPFSFLGIISEAGSSVSFVNRMGLAKANEVLIFGKKLDAEELVSCGFVNKIFPKQSCESFHASVRKHLEEQIEGLDPIAILKIKDLIQTGINEKNSKDGTNLRESYAQAERFASGIPVRRFSQIANKEIKHKL